jgi:hypothetical protein
MRLQSRSTLPRARSASTVQTSGKPWTNPTAPSSAYAFGSSRRVPVSRNTTGIAGKATAGGTSEQMGHANLALGGRQAARRIDARITLRAEYDTVWNLCQQFGGPDRKVAEIAVEELAPQCGHVSNSLRESKETSGFHVIHEVG